MAGWSHFYFFGIIFVCLPFLNDKHVDTHRWIDIGLPFMIQPSEFVKVFTVLALARYLSDHNLRMKNVSEKESNCFWCTCSFDNPAIYIPKN